MYVITVNKQPVSLSVVEIKFKKMNTMEAKEDDYNLVTYDRLW